MGPGDHQHCEQDASGQEDPKLEVIVEIFSSDSEPMGRALRGCNHSPLTRMNIRGAAGFAGWISESITAWPWPSVLSVRMGFHGSVSPRSADASIIAVEKGDAPPTVPEKMPHGAKGSEVSKVMVSPPNASPGPADGGGAVASPVLEVADSRKLAS